MTELLGEQGLFKGRICGDDLLYCWQKGRFQSGVPHLVGQQLLANEMRDARLKAPLLPTVKQIITANAAFEQALFAKQLCHMDQPSLTQAVSNCEKRAIGSGGGFGYRSIKEGVAIELLDSVILACWQCAQAKPARRQTISY